MYVVLGGKCSDEIDFEIWTRSASQHEQFWDVFFFDKFWYTFEVDDWWYDAIKCVRYDEMNKVTAMRLMLQIIFCLNKRNNDETNHQPNFDQILSILTIMESTW